VTSLRHLAPSWHLAVLHMGVVFHSVKELRYRKSSFVRPFPFLCDFGQPKPNSLGLVEQKWVTSLCHLAPSSSPNLIATGNGAGTVHLFDTAAQKRPVASWASGGSPVKVLLPAGKAGGGTPWGGGKGGVPGDGSVDSLVFSTADGMLGLLDIRKGERAPPSQLQCCPRCALHCTVAYCTVLYCTALESSQLYGTALHCTVLYLIARYPLYCTLLFCAILCCAVRFQASCWASSRAQGGALKSLTRHPQLPLMATCGECHHCTVQYSTVQCSTVQYRTGQDSAVQWFWTLLYSTVLYLQ